MGCKILMQRDLKINNIYVYIANQHLEMQFLRILLGNVINLHVKSFVDILGFALPLSSYQRGKRSEKYKDVFSTNFLSKIVLQQCFWDRAKLSNLAECNI